ncbi:sterol desaturase family protein [Caenimonas koreensis]|uniref:Fatty acid hydroxylase domain-containing protein n=1 Tax=Caenimonas koreensis DSM 17982 TaxID=1121255 RepID=A0A844B1X3_9BURK|nr:sterol desaturase family protein [Caenimonas koreensis]MRD47272.1 hypothetical protein [Caenimonas koreensis DSM 17982]
MNIPQQELIRYLDLLNTYGWIALVFLLERLLPTRKIPYLSRGWISDLFHMFEPWIRAFFVGGLVALAVPYAMKLPGTGWLQGQPLWLNFVVLAIINEAVFYFTHRLMHTVPWLWEFHRVHHSSTTYYSLMTTRFHLLDVIFFGAPYFIAATFLGARAEAVIALSLFQGFVDRFGHSNIRTPHFVAYFIGSPKFHAWHHSNAPEAHDMNFSRDFTFMDYLFGTAYYPKDKIAQDFGDPQFPTNYVQQQLMPFWVLGRKLAGKSTAPVLAAPHAAAGAGHEAEPPAQARNS